MSATARSATTRPLRVHALVDTLDSGGAEFLLAEFAAVAAGAGMDLSVAALKPLTPLSFAADRLRACGLEPQAVPVSSMVHPREIRRVRAHLADIRPQLVHTHLGTSDFLGGVAARSLGIPSLTTIHANWWPGGRADRLRNWLTARARRHCAAVVIAVSESAKSAYVEARCDVPGHVEVVHNGIVDRARPGSGAAVRRELGLAPDELVITALSKLRPEKNFEASIDAVSLIRRRFPKARLVIAGDGPHEEAVRRHAAGLGDGVVLAGHREDTMELLDASDILVHPSHFDAFPTALLEAMAAAVPVVATGAGGMLEIVEPDVTGILVPPPPSAEALAVALTPLVQRAELRARLGAAGRGRYEREFTAAAWARRVRAVYDRVLGGRAPARSRERPGAAACQKRRRTYTEVQRGAEAVGEEWSRGGCPPMRSAPVPSPRRPKLLPAGLLRLVSDERLVEQIRAGSERAFEALFDRHYRSLLAFCRYMLRSREEAEDVVQQTFLAAYCDVLRSDKPITPRPWLFAIARNRCLSVLRSQRERALDEVTLVADNLAAEVDRLEDLRGLIADLARLPDDQRAALLLTELSGVPHDEIGRMLGCRQERVKALVFQARATLAADRTARETPCYEIRTQLATMRGGALRRSVLRRHVRNCPGCRAFQAKVRLQRRQLGALLPAGPGLGLPALLPGALTGSGAAGLGGLTLKAGALGSGLVATALVGAALTSGGAVAGVTGVGHGGATPAVSPAAPTARADADPQPATVVRGPQTAPAATEDQAVPRLAGGPVPYAAVKELQPGLLTPGPVAAGGVPEYAGGQDRAPVPEPPPAATGGEAAEPAGQAAAAAEEPVDAPQEPDEKTSSKPPEPSSPPDPGQGPAAGSSAPPQAHGHAGHGPPPWAGGPAAPELPAPALRGRQSGRVPHVDGPEPPAGQAGENGRPETSSHSRAEAAVTHAKALRGGPATSAPASAADHDPPPAAEPASPPGADASPGDDAR